LCPPERLTLCSARARPAIPFVQSRLLDRCNEVGWTWRLVNGAAHTLILLLATNRSSRAQERTADALPPSLSLSLDPHLPQNGGFVVAPLPGELPVRARADTPGWKVWVSGYVRAPLRWSWGPATTPDPKGGTAGRQIRTPPLVPDATNTDWRYTGSLVPPWTELDFHV